MLAIVFFLLQPAGLLIDPVEPSDKVGAVTAYASNAELTRLTSMLIALGLVAMFFGYTVVWSDLRDSGRPDVLVRYGILFLLIGVTAWILVQGIHIVLASTNLQSPESIGGAASVYAVGSGVTLIGGLVVAMGFVLMSLGLTSKGGWYKIAGLVVAVVSLVALISLVVGISSPGNLGTGVTIARYCYVPWVIWSVMLGADLLREETEPAS